MPYECQAGPRQSEECYEEDELKAELVPFVASPDRVVLHDGDDADDMGVVVLKGVLHMRHPAVVQEVDPRVPACRAMAITSR